MLHRFVSLFPTAALSALVALTMGCGAYDDGAQGESPGERQDALLGAPVDPGHKFAVGICAGGLKADGTCASLRCSGSLIAPNLVLTARHCLDQIAYSDVAWCASTFTEPLSSEPTLVTTSDSVRIGTPKWYDVETKLVPGDNGLCSGDIALLVLSAPVPAEEAPTVRVDTVHDFAKHPPVEVAVVGRGAIAQSLDLTTGATTVDNGSGLRRIAEHIPFVCATNSASAPCNVVDYSSPPTNMFASPPDYYVIGSSLASGDSGSGVMDQKHFDNDHARRVIGVSAAGTWGADGLPNYGLVSRLDTHRTFLRDGLKVAAQAAGLAGSAFDYADGD